MITRHPFPLMAMLLVAAPAAAALDSRDVAVRERVAPVVAAARISAAPVAERFLAPPVPTCACDRPAAVAAAAASAVGAASAAGLRLLASDGRHELWAVRDGAPAIVRIVRADRSTTDVALAGVTRVETAMLEGGTAVLDVVAAGGAPRRLRLDLRTGAVFGSFEVERR